MIEFDKHGELMMSEDKTDKDLERQYRKNLMVVASIVLIYSIAGGKMAADLSLFGAKLQFSRPDLLEYAMVAVMCFFWWRHWQVSGWIRVDRMKRILASTKVAEITKETLSKLVIPEHITRKKEAGFILASINVTIPDEVSVIVEKVNLRAISLNLSFYFNGMYDHVPVTLRFRDTPLGFMFIQCSYFRAWITNAIEDTHFGDAILPSLTTISALIAYSCLKLA